MNNIIYDNHVSINIDDQSIVQDIQTEALEDSLAFLFPIFSSRGKDNEIFEFRSSGAFKSFYGDDVDDYNKYGQANINAMGALRSGSRVFGCRLLPSDAKRANVMLGVAVAPASEIPQWMREDTIIENGSVISIGTGAFTLDQNGNKIPIMIPNTATTEDPYDVVQLTLPGIKIKLVKKIINTYDVFGNPDYNGAPYNIVEDDTTWTVYPLFMMYYYGRGKGGNNFGIKIQRDIAHDRTVSDGRRYVLDLFEYLESGSVIPLFSESIYFSFNPNAIYSQNSYIKEGLKFVYTNTDENGKERPLQLVTFNNYETLTNVIYPHIVSGTTDDVDFIFGVDKNGIPYNKVQIDPNTIDPANSVIMLSGGTDGSLELGATVMVNDVPTTVTESMVNATKNALLMSFFNCDIDNSIFDEKIVDCDIITDANYPDQIKRQILSKMPLYRPDIFLVIDCGITYNYKEALNKASDITGYVDGDWDFMAMIGGQAGFTNDPSIITPVPVTYTYDFIRTISELYSTPTGRFQMLAGFQNGRTRYVKWNWLAEKDKNNMLLKLEKAKINYVERVNKRGETMYGTEITLYDKDYSKLTSVRNALVIGDAMRICHKVLIKYKYDPRSVLSAIDAATVEMTNVLRGRYPDTIGVEVTIYQTKRDKNTDNAHCDIIFTFPNIIKKFTVTIVARREDIVNKAA